MPQKVVSNFHNRRRPFGKHKKNATREYSRGWLCYKKNDRFLILYFALCILHFAFNFGIKPPCPARAPAKPENFVLSFFAERPTPNGIFVLNPHGRLRLATHEA
jgi:hypothetical protein